MKLGAQFVEKSALNIEHLYFLFYLMYLILPKFHNHVFNIKFAPTLKNINTVHMYMYKVFRKKVSILIKILVRFTKNSIKRDIFLSTPCINKIYFSVCYFADADIAIKPLSPCT